MHLQTYLDNQGYTLQEFSFDGLDGKSLYWHSSILDSMKRPLAGGFGKNTDLSRKIAFAECLERHYYLDLFGFRKPESAEWGIEHLDTGCGFAAGFDLRNTVTRSIYEAVERWALSKWVDCGFELSKLAAGLQRISPSSEWFSSQFEEVELYHKSSAILFGSNLLKFEIVASVAFIEGGVYLGSAVRGGLEEAVEHSLLESFRHKILVKNSTPTGRFPDNRVRFFSSNSKLAVAQIQSSKNPNWPTPRIVFHNHRLVSEGFHLARTILDGWTAWDKGPVDRFLY